MDFLLTPTIPAGDIPWEKVLPPLIPRLNGAFGHHNWSPTLLVPETDNGNAAEVGDFNVFNIFLKNKHLIIYLSV